MTDAALQSGTAPSHLLPAVPRKYATVLLLLIVTFRLLNGSTLHQPYVPHSSLTAFL